MQTIGLFSGIGGIESGLEQAGCKPILLCEIDPAAQAVLKHRFPDCPLESDITRLAALPQAEVVTAGFPCQDLSQAGRTRGISGDKSSLVENVFRLIRTMPKPPHWLLLENVPFMLHLQQGSAMSYLVSQVQSLGYRWAYRVIDARAFGLPQRRTRVVFLASPYHDPVNVLLRGEVEAPQFDAVDACMAGFYWTEGRSGLGWTPNGVPPLKAGSTIGIACPPAIWNRETGEISVPDIRDAERLQGFTADWTLAVEDQGMKRSHRWRLIGNSVSVPMFEWIGRRLFYFYSPQPIHGHRLQSQATGWKSAGWGCKTEAYTTSLSTFPCMEPYKHLSEFLEYPTQPLSHRAASGFLSRALESQLRFAPQFIEDVEMYVEGSCLRSPSSVLK